MHTQTHVLWHPGSSAQPSLPQLGPWCTVACSETSAHDRAAHTPRTRGATTTTQQQTHTHTRANTATYLYVSASILLSICSRWSCSNRCRSAREFCCSNIFRTSGVEKAARMAFRIARRETPCASTRVMLPDVMCASDSSNSCTHRHGLVTTGTQDPDPKQASAWHTSSCRSVVALVSAYSSSSSTARNFSTSCEPPHHVSLPPALAAAPRHTHSKLGFQPLDLKHDVLLQRFLFTATERSHRAPATTAASASAGYSRAARQWLGPARALSSVWPVPAPARV